jgi:hypothetical protein
MLALSFFLQFKSNFLPVKIFETYDAIFIIQIQILTDTILSCPQNSPEFNKRTAFLYEWKHRANNMFFFLTNSRLSYRIGIRGQNLGHYITAKKILRCMHSVELGVEAFKYDYFLSYLSPIGGFDIDRLLGFWTLFAATWHGPIMPPVHLCGSASSLEWIRCIEGWSGPFDSDWIVRIVTLDRIALFNLSVFFSGLHGRWMRDLM